MTSSKALPDLNGAIRDGPSCRDLIARISQRCCSNEVDKIAGLLHFFTEQALPVLPVYKPDETTQQAWHRLIDALSNSWRFELATTFWLHVAWQGRLYPSWETLLRTPECEGDITRASLHITLPLASLFDRILSMKLRKTSVKQGRLCLVGPIALPCMFWIWDSHRSDNNISNPWTPVNVKLSGKPGLGALQPSMDPLITIRTHQTSTCVDSSDSESDSESDSKANLERNSKRNSQIDSESGWESGSESDTESDSKANLERNSKRNSQIDLESGSESDSEGWHKSEFLRVNFTPSPLEIYYLVPQICLNTPDSPKGPLDYIANTFSNTFPPHSKRGTTETRFLVCKELGGNSSWDGISYQKVGDARMRMPLHPSLINAHGLLESEFCARYTADGCNWRQVLEDIHSLGSKDMGRKYGTRAVYSLIYGSHGVSVESSEAWTNLHRRVGLIGRVSRVSRWPHLAGLVELAGLAALVELGGLVV